MTFLNRFSNLYHYFAFLRSNKKLEVWTVETLAKPVERKLLVLNCCSMRSSQDHPLYRPSITERGICMLMERKLVMFGRVKVEALFSHATEEKSGMEVGGGGEGVHSEL